MFHAEKAFVGLDLSLRSTGLCVLSSVGAPLRVASFGAPLERGSTHKQKIQRLSALTKRVLDEIEPYAKEPNGVSIAIENYAFGARGAQNDLGELHGCIKLQIYHVFGIVPLIVTASSCRKIVVGKGNTKKEDAFKYAVLALNDLGHLATINGDEADAYLIAEWNRRTTLKGEK
jgi:Holliday junction resolvasome RuvABC endonuclease subunit